MSRDTLYFDPHLREPLEAYLPVSSTRQPCVTLTYAVSLDSQIAAAPGTQTALSGPLSKSMTHYLRTCHDAILVGSGTAIADDPTLNSRLNDAHTLDHQPRPIILDRRGQWNVSMQSKVVRAATAGRGKGPWVLIDPAVLANVADSRVEALRACDGRYVPFTGGWNELMTLLLQLSIHSVMIEGGAQIINGLLTDYMQLVNSVIVTIAPVYLGSGGVSIAPDASRNFKDIRWQTLEQDAVISRLSNAIKAQPARRSDTASSSRSV